jgi:hypothetical protein
LVHGSNAGESLCIAILNHNQQKHFVSLIIAFVFSPTKLEIRAEQILPGSEEGGGRGRGRGVRGSNDPNNVCTCE